MARCGPRAGPASGSDWPEWTLSAPAVPGLNEPNAIRAPGVQFAPGTTVGTATVAFGAAAATSVSCASATSGAAASPSSSGTVTTTYSYDTLSRLTSVSGAATASYADNGDGLRVSKTTEGGTTVSFAWDPTGIGQLLGDSTGAAYLWGQGLVASTFQGTLRYLLDDSLGSPLAQLVGGTVVASARYSAFGLVAAETGAQTVIGFAGEQTDTETGFQYLRARYYDPSIGRFITRDPAAGPGQNAYPYAGSNPTSRTDPTGLLTITCPQTRATTMNNLPPADGSR